jgi:hypothetical protein
MVNIFDQDVPHCGGILECRFLALGNNRPPGQTKGLNGKKSETRNTGQTKLTTTQTPIASQE